MIVAADVTDNAADVGNLIPMTERTVTNTGRVPRQVTADAGYCSDDNLARAGEVTAATGTEFFIATGRHKHDAAIPDSPRGRIPNNATRRERMARKDQQLRTAAPGTAEFLLGAAPTWGDVADGFAAAFQFDADLLTKIHDLTDGTIAVIGSAGSGKSTSLMRVAVTLAAQGETVVWLDRETESSISHIKEEVARLAPRYVFIDDLDRFAGEAANAPAMTSV